MPYTNQCNSKISEFQNSEFDLFFFMNSFHKIDLFQQVIKSHHLLFSLRVFSSTFDMLKTRASAQRGLEYPRPVPFFNYKNNLSLRQ